MAQWVLAGEPIHPVDFVVLFSQEALVVSSMSITAWRFPARRHGMVVPGTSITAWWIPACRSRHGGRLLPARSLDRANVCCEKSTTVA
jgi:hypothetical protein